MATKQEGPGPNVDPKTAGLSSRGHPQKGPHLTCRNCHIFVYNHLEVDRILGMQGTHHGTFKDHILSIPGWVYIGLECPKLNML